MTASRPDSEPVPTISGLADIADRFDVILCDVWGVLHDGVRAHIGASDALIRFRDRAGGTRPRRVVLVSNAPRPWRGVQTILDGYGVPREAYDAILTSGDLTRALLSETPGARIHHLGPERDATIFTDLDIRLVGAEAAETVVCTGLFDDTRETAEDYRAHLEQWHARDVPMICANPDLVVERAGLLIPCAGLIAEAYAALGGRVTYAGKPYTPVYAAALAMAGDLDGLAAPAPTRVLAVGDALRTDIAGAGAFGLPNLLVARGIHAEELGVATADATLGDIATWLAAQSVRPDAVIERLVW